jgi:O-antigen ligase
MSLPHFNLKLIGFLLLGYMFLDRGFAYVGYSPIFIGELVLAVTIFIAAITKFNLLAINNPIGYALLAFIAWAVGILTLNSSANLFDAFRDSVIWGYSLYALFVASLLLSLRSIDQTLRTYTRVLTWFAVWSMPAYVAGYYLSINNMLPYYPNTKVALISIKAGDLAVHLAGVAAFLALGLHQAFAYKRRTWSIFQEYLCYFSVFAGIVALGSRNRGGLFSVLLALLVVVVFRPNNRLTRLIIPSIIAAILLITFDVSIPVGGGREVSINQILANIQSVIWKSEEQYLAGTVDWRFNWWTAIINNAIHGDGFWVGNGFGSSLAALYGFSDATGNRSPHNGHLTILARMGVPGFVLWLNVIFITYWHLIRCYFTALRNNKPELAKINLWVMAYLAAMLFNMSFDVYLEGPQGGIWFWCFVGFAIALTCSQRNFAKSQSNLDDGQRRTGLREGAISR